MSFLNWDLKENNNVKQKKKKSYFIDGEILNKIKNLTCHKYESFVKLIPAESIFFYYNFFEFFPLRDIWLINCQLDRKIHE